MAEINWEQTVKEKEAENSALNDRRKRDTELYRLTKFTLKDPDGRSISRSRNITLNDPRTYADHVISTVKGAELTREIEGEQLKDKDASAIEQMLADYMSLADAEMAWLNIRGGLIGSAAGQVAIPGGVAWRSYPYVDKGKFHPGLIPWDINHVAYEVGRDGYSWASYRMKKSKAAINSEYPDANYTGKEGEVVDILTPDENIILIDGSEFKKAKHKFGYTPVIIELNDTSVFLRDEDYMEYEGEGIYASVRDLYTELNELASIFKTINFRAFQGSMLFETEDPSQISPPMANVYGEREVIYVKIGEKVVPVPISDIKKSTLYLLNLIEARLQRGSLPATDYGNLAFTLSAVAIKALGEAKNSVLVPLLDTISRALKRLYVMIIEQWVIGGFSDDEITAPKAGILQSKYKIGIELSAISPVENIANYTVADAASRWMDDEQILSDIIHDPNPAETIQRKRSQDAEELSPRLKIWRKAKALLAEGEELEAAMLIGEIGLSLEQLKSGEIDTGKPVQGPGNRQGPSLPGLFGNSRVTPGAKSSNQEAAEMASNLGVGNA